MAEFFDIVDETGQPTGEIISRDGFLRLRAWDAQREMKKKNSGRASLMKSCRG